MPVLAVSKTWLSTTSMVPRTRSIAMSAMPKSLELTLKLDSIMLIGALLPFSAFRYAWKPQPVLPKLRQSLNVTLDSRCDGWSGSRSTPLEL